MKEKLKGNDGVPEWTKLTDDDVICHPTMKDMPKQKK